MKLHSPAFEKSLRTRVKGILRHSPELRSEAQGGPLWSKNFRSGKALRVVLSGMVGLMAWLAVSKTGHPVTALAVIALWTFFLVFTGAQRLLEALYQDSDLGALSLLPVDSSTAFRWEFQKFLRGSLFSILDLLCGFGAVAWWLDLSAMRWVAAIPIVALTWLTLLALQMLSASCLPQFPFHLSSTLGAAAGFLLYVSFSHAGQEILAILDSSAPQLHFVLPTGWPVSLFELLLPEPTWFLLAPVLPTAAVIVTIWISIIRLRRGYEFEEVVMAEAPDLVLDAVEGSDSGEAPSNERTPRVGMTEIEETIRSRQFLDGSQWRNGRWLEGLLWRWLTVREKALAEFVFPDGPAITALWKWIGKIVFIALVCSFLVHFVLPGVVAWILFPGLVITALIAFGQVCDTGSAFESIQCSGVHIPRYAIFPIGFRELGGLLMKVSLAQAPFLLAYALVAGCVTAYLVEKPVPVGAIFGGKIAALILASRPYGILLSFSGTTNDTTGFRRKMTMMLGLIVPGGLFFLALAAICLFWPGAPGWGFCIAAWLQSYGCYRVYGWTFNRNRFDLVQEITE